MMEKFLLLAFIGISFVQAEEVGDFIERGLARAKGLNEDTVKAIDDALKEVSSTRTTMEAETVEFVEKSLGVQTDVRETLASEAQAMKERAKETQKPETTFKCITNAENTANNRVAILTNKFKVDMDRLQNIRLANVETDSKPLNGMHEALRVKYERTVKQVIICNGQRCVDTAVNSFESWLNLTLANIKRILVQIGRVYFHFNKDANTNFDNSFKLIDATKSSAARNIRLCV